MTEFFENNRKLISAALEKFMAGEEELASKINTFGSGLIKQLCEFILAGKMLRGGMVILSNRIFGGLETGLLINAACAMELIHSGFLIHDDIMDRDEFRRGMRSMFSRYRLEAEQSGMKDPLHYGESMGICAGDMAYFLAFKLLSSQLTNAIDAAGVISLCAGEDIAVTSAQMQDVYYGSSADNPDEDDILKLYIYKTGRYTFSLPLLCGALLAGAGENERKIISEFGEKTGIIFQIRDDELGLFGREEVTGKPVGSDIRENKKNLIRFYLIRNSSAEERRRIEQIINSGNPAPGDIRWIAETAERIGIKRIINEKIDKLSGEALLLIRNLKIADPVLRETLEDLLAYSGKRPK